MIVDFCIDMSILEDDFFEELDEIMEDTMINIFVLHPKTLQELEKAKAFSAKYNSLFYALPLELLDAYRDENCKAVYLNDTPLSLSELDTIDLAVCISAKLMDEGFTKIVAATKAKGVILDANKNYHIPHFFEGMTLNKLSNFPKKKLEDINMKHIVLHSNYPYQTFESIDETAKLISDAIFRPDESIKNCATVNSLNLLKIR